MSSSGLYGVENKFQGRNVFFTLDLKIIFSFIDLLILAYLFQVQGTIHPKNRRVLESVVDDAVYKLRFRQGNISTLLFFIIKHCVI